MKRTIFFGCCLALDAVVGEMSSPPKAKIDTHAHFLPDFYAQALRDAGHVPGPDGMPSIPDWTPEEHLQFMASLDIEKSYLSISSPGVYLSVPSRSATEKAISLARQVNEYAARLKAEYPDKFGFFASLPLPDVKASVDEITYCFTQLYPRPDGVVMLSNAYGLYFGDPALDPVFEALDRLNVTVFQHPTTPCTEHNHQQPIAVRQGKTPVLDFPFDTARNFADMLYSTVPARFPGIKWIVPHSGGGLVPTIDRIIALGDPALNTSSVKDTLARSFYFDLTGPWPVTFAIPALLRWVGHEKLLWGSDVPFTPWASAATGGASFDQGVEVVFNNTSDAQDVRKNNAVRLLG